MPHPDQTLGKFSKSLAFTGLSTRCADLCVWNDKAAGLSLHQFGRVFLAEPGQTPARAVEKRTIVVPDVEAFPGHIACDAASRSEVVIPLLTGRGLLGVLDIDSPKVARFDESDARGLERLARRAAELG